MLRKFTLFLWILLPLLAVVSCANDDDICTSGEATPRLKVKFKNQNTGKLLTLDSLYVAVDYGNGPQFVSSSAKVDSVLIPLRVDEQTFTDVFIKTSAKGSTSKFRLNYSTKNEYVSPACGIKRLYSNFGSQLLQQNPVLGTENNQSEISDENKTHLYLLF